MELTFDEKQHIYRINGIRVPSVNQVEKPIVDYSGVPPEVLQRAADFGIAAHRLFQLYFEETLDFSTVCVGLKGILKGIEQFAKEYRTLLDAPKMLELRMGHEDLWYAGTPDMILPEDTIDLKTRRYAPCSDPIALSAYNELVRHNIFPSQKKRNAWILQISVDGKIQFIKAEHPQAWNRFRQLLDYHYQPTSELLKKINAWGKK